MQTEKIIPPLSLLGAAVRSAIEGINCTQAPCIQRRAGEQRAKMT